MIDKKISLGTIITIVTIVGTFIYTQGALATKMEMYEQDNMTLSKEITKNKDSLIDLQIRGARLETKIEEGFKNIETLIIEN